MQPCRFSFAQAVVIAFIISLVAFAPAVYAFAAADADSGTGSVGEQGVGASSNSTVGDGADSASTNNAGPSEACLNGRHLSNHELAQAQLPDSRLADMDLPADKVQFAKKIDDLTKQILRHELAFERLNTEFRIVSLKDDCMRGWRQFGYSQTNAALTEAGLIEAVRLRYHYLREKTPYDSKGKRGKRKAINKVALEHAIIPQLIGNCIGAAGPVIELTVNTCKYFHERHEEMTPEQVYGRVNKIESETQLLLAQRERLITAAVYLNDGERAVLSSENKVLEDIRQLSRMQFQRYYVAAKKFSAFQISAYLIDCTRNILGGAGGIISLYAAGARKPEAGGVANIFTMLSGFGAMAIPTGSHLMSHYVGIWERNRLFPDLNDICGIPKYEANRVLHYESDLDDLVKLMSSSKDMGTVNSVRTRLYIYAHQDVLFSNQEAVAVRDIRQDLNTTLQTFAVGGTAGSTKVTNGILGMIAGFKYYHADKAIQSSSFAAAGNTTYLIGTSAQILEVFREKIAQQYTTHKLHEKGLTPTQLRKQRLLIIAIMEKLVGE